MIIECCYSDKDTCYIVNTLRSRLFIKGFWGGASSCMAWLERWPGKIVIGLHISRDQFFLGQVLVSW